MSNSKLMYSTVLLVFSLSIGSAIHMIANAKTTSLEATAQTTQKEVRLSPEDFRRMLAAK